MTTRKSGPLLQFLTTRSTKGSTENHSSALLSMRHIRQNQEILKSSWMFTVSNGLSFFYTFSVDNSSLMLFSDYLGHPRKELNFLQSLIVCVFAQTSAIFSCVKFALSVSQSLEVRDEQKLSSHFLLSLFVVSHQKKNIREVFCYPMDGTQAREKNEGNAWFGGLRSVVYFSLDRTTTRKCFHWREKNCLKYLFGVLRRQI